MKTQTFFEKLSSLRPGIVDVSKAGYSERCAFLLFERFRFSFSSYGLEDPTEFNQFVFKYFKAYLRVRNVVFRDDISIRGDHYVFASDDTDYIGLNTISGEIELLDAYEANTQVGQYPVVITKVADSFESYLDALLKIFEIEKALILKEGLSEVQIKGRVEEIIQLAGGESYRDYYFRFYHDIYY